LAYRAVVFRDELPESTRQDPAHRSTLERVCAALVDRDEALWQARSDLEKMRTMATNWEAEVASVRSENRGLRSSLEGRRRSSARPRSGHAGWSSGPRRPTT
jgi:hypothetical protein